MFLPAAFAQLTPQDIYLWMIDRAFDVDEPPYNGDIHAVDPTSEDATPRCRSSGIEFCKKALSFYMPNSIGAWNYVAATPFGNPTKSKEVNDLIKHIKRCEVRGKGKKSKARREFKTAEWRALIECWESCPEWCNMYRNATIQRHMHHLILRPDDVCMFEQKGLMPHDRFDFALLQQVRWSKNVLEERDCPPQILLGAMDTYYCLLLSLAIYMEYRFKCQDGATRRFLYCDDNDDGCPKRYKGTFGRMWNKIAASDHFQAVHQQFQQPNSQPIGVYAYRKYAKTYATARGIPDEQSDLRGRWRNKRQKASDRYNAPDRPYIDAKVADALCPGGSIKYKLRPDSGVNDDWIYQYVVPETRAYYGEYSTVAKVLGTALLWACFEPTMEPRVPPILWNDVRNAYAMVPNRLEDGINPVKKVCHVVFALYFETASHSFDALS
jgi:hypothetical protein